MHFLYRHFDESGALLYVGVSANPARRLRDHQDYRKWFEDIRQVTMERCYSRADALEKERAAILAEKPVYNIQARKSPKSPADPLMEKFVEWGRQGGLKGGKARARKLSAKQRQKIASAAGKARWAKARNAACKSETEGG